MATLLRRAALCGVLCRYLMISVSHSIKAALGRSAPFRGKEGGDRDDMSPLLSRPCSRLA